MEPIFSAVSNNANHLYTLLRCIGFASKASVQLTPDGIRFSVEENRVMQGLAFLDKALFTTYTFNPPTTGQDANDMDDEEQDNTIHPQFLVSLSALLETLQIFGIGDTNLPSSSFSNPAPQSSAAGAFTNPALLLGRSCTLRYQNIGSPLSITLSESGITTTCELTTYESDDPSFGPAAGELDIPLQRDAIIMKIIMRSAWLHNAITELDGTNPTVLSISASSKKEPFFALSGSGGPFSESTVEFSIDKNHHDNDLNHKPLTRDGEAPSRRTKFAPTVTETFQVTPPSSMGSRVKENYRFALIRKAARAMAAATKVSIRGDIQGVLGMQFMIELGDNGNASGGNLPNEGVSRNVSFVDFRFVPLIDEDDGEEEDEMISF